MKQEKVTCHVFSRPQLRWLQILYAVVLILLATLAFGATVNAQGDQIFLFPACANGLQVDINGAAAPGALVTSISWNWGDGSTTTGFFPQSHIYATANSFNVQVMSHYTDGSNVSTSQTVTVGPGILTNCVALTITAGQYGSVSYQASVGAGTVPPGSYTTLELDFADDLTLSANPDPAFSFSSWSPSGGITGINGSPVSTASPSILIVVDASSTINGNFVVSLVLPPTPTATPPLSNFPPFSGLFNNQASSFFTIFKNQTSPNAQSWLTSSSISTNVSTANNFLGLKFGQGYKNAFSNISTAASLVSTGVGLAGSLIPGETLAQGVLLTATGLALGTPAAQSRLSPIQSVTDQLALDGASALVSCFGALTGVPTFDLGCGLTIGGTLADITSDVSSALAADPYDSNYKVVFVPQPIVATAAPLTTVSQQLGAAEWASINAVDESTMWANALRVTANRYGTALANSDATSASLQYMAFLDYFGLYINAAGSASVALTTLADDLKAQGLGTQAVTEQEIQQGLSFLETQGASSPFINTFFSSLGFTPEQIQTMIYQATTKPPSAPTTTPVRALGSLAEAFARPGVHLAASVNSIAFDSVNHQYRISLNIVNTGTGTANGTIVTAAEIGSAPTLSKLPIILGNIPYAGSASVTLTFPILGPGQLKIVETYQGGSAEQAI